MKALVLRSFKGRKRELRITIIMLTLVYMCGIMTILFQESFYRSRESLRYDTYGEWTGAVFGASEETEQMIKKLESTKQIGKIVMLGSSWQNGKRFGNAGFMDQTAQDLGRLKLLEGDFPTEPTEAVLTETAVNRLREKVKVGDNIELALTEDGEPKSYILSGIVKPWGGKWKTESQELPSVILGADDTIQGEIYLLFQNENRNEMNHIQAHVASLGEGMYVYNDASYPLDDSVIDEFFQDGKFVYFLVLISAILICYLMMLTLKSRRYSLTILRGLGADAKEVLQMILWETLFLWGASFLAGAVLGVITSGAALYTVHRILNMPVHLVIRTEFILEYIVCVTVVYFMSNLGIALTVIRSQIHTTFRADSGLLDRSAPPNLKKPEPLTFSICLKRKWAFYRKIYVVRFAISIIVMVISSICLQHFIEAKNQYEAWMDSVEYAYSYNADRPAGGLTESQIEELEAINGVKSVEKETYINSSVMMQDSEGSPEIKISAPAFQDSVYVDTYRQYSQKNLGIPVDKEGDYFSVWELRGISSRDEEMLSCYEKETNIGNFDRVRFLSGEECVLILPPYQIRDLGGGKMPEYLNETELEESKEIYTYEMDEHAIAPGDMVKITTPWGESKIRVGAIITSRDADLAVNVQVAAVSEEFVNLLCGFEQSRYTAVKINLDETMDIARTGEEVEGYFETLEQGRENLTNFGNTVKGFAETSMFEGAQYLFVLTMVWLIYMLMMYHGNQAYLKNEGKRIGVLRTLGMKKIMLRVRYLLENLSEGGLIILISFGIAAGEFFIRLRKQAPYDSVNALMRSLTDHPEAVRLFLMALLIALIVFLGVSGVTLYLPLKRISDRSIVENLGNGEKR